MSTHATLLMRNLAVNGGPKHYGLVHVHFDGYPTAVGAALRDFHSSKEQVAKILAIGCLDSIKDDRLVEHTDPSDNPGVQWFWGLEQGMMEAKPGRGIGAYSYFWDGKCWRQIDSIGEGLTGPIQAPPRLDDQIAALLKADEGPAR